MANRLSQLQYFPEAEPTTGDFQLSWPSGGQLRNPTSGCRMHKVAVAGYAEDCGDGSWARALPAVGPSNAGNTAWNIGAKASTKAREWAAVLVRERMEMEIGVGSL